MFELDTEQDILIKITNMFNPNFKPFYSITLSDNKSTTKSITVSCPASAFHDPVESALFARIRINGKKPYISFKDKYADLFTAADIPFYKLKSEHDFIRIGLDIFYNFLNKPDILCPIMQSIFMELFSFAPFGCCDRFEKCSDEMKCIHADLIYATVCQYSKNLNAGKIFYGKNRNTW